MSVDTAALNDDLEFLFHDDRSLEKRLAGADREVARILDRARAGHRPTVEEGVKLLGARNGTLSA